MLFFQLSFVHIGTNLQLLNLRTQSWVVQKHSVPFLPVILQHQADQCHQLLPDRKRKGKGKVCIVLRGCSFTAGFAFPGGRTAELHQPNTPPMLPSPQGAQISSHSCPLGTLLFHPVQGECSDWFLTEPREELFEHKQGIFLPSTVYKLSHLQHIEQQS